MLPLICDISTLVYINFYTREVFYNWILSLFLSQNCYSSVLLCYNLVLHVCSRVLQGFLSFLQDARRIIYCIGFTIECD